VIGNLIFRQPLKYDTPWPVSLLMIVIVIALSGVIRAPRRRSSRDGHEQLPTLGCSQGAGALGVIVTADAVYGQVIGGTMSLFRCPLASPDCSGRTAPASPRS
jgi:hypothetical protein